MKLEKLWDDLRASLWFRPAAWVTTLGLLALILITIEPDWRQSAITRQVAWLFASDASEVQFILGTISAATVTVATLAFSIIFVAVVQTANAYSPRLLRLYLGDTAHQHVLGILIGTFLFCLLVLRAMNTTADEASIPTLGVTTAILLSLLSLGAFIYFIDHVAHSIEVDNIISLIMHNTMSLFDKLFPSELGQPYPAEVPPTLPTEPPALVMAPGSGYVQYIEAEPILEAATRQGLVVRLERLTGDYVLAGTPLASVWPAAALNEALTQTLQEAFQLGTERTLVQDLYFGVRQLSDIALRAISPAVNDPTTAVNCLDALATLLIKMIQLEPVSPYRCDAESNLRVIAFGPTFEVMLDLAFNQIRQYAARDYACTLRLIELCGEITYGASRPIERAWLWRHLKMVACSAAQNFGEPNDRAEINKRLLKAAEILQQDAQPLLLT